MEALEAVIVQVLLDLRLAQALDRRADVVLLELCANVFANEMKSNQIEVLQYITFQHNHLLYCMVQVPSSTATAESEESL